MRVLLSAYACEPDRGSEPGVGWNNAKALAHRHEVWVLTSHTHQPATDAWLARNPEPNLHVVYLDPFGWVVNWARKRTRWGIHLHYHLWQIWAYFVARALHRKVRFDVAHHVTYVKYSTPSFVALLPIPFFWGPVGGGEDTPKPFWKDFDARANVYETARALARLLGEWDPFVRMMAKRSAFAWATTEQTAVRLRRLGARNVEVASAVALALPEAEALGRLPEPGAGPMRFIGMGELLHLKGFNLGLRAFAAAGLPDAEYWILGDGPERQKLEAMAADLGIAHQVKFWGALDRKTALARIGECHALLLPTLHDSGSWVCLEAMAAGRPVVCLALGGPGVLVSPDCGILVPAHTPAQAVADLATALTNLAADPDTRRRMGQAGKRRIKDHLNWDAHVDVVVHEYAKVVPDVA